MCPVVAALGKDQRGRVRKAKKKLDAAPGLFPQLFYVFSLVSFLGFPAALPVDPCCDHPVTNRPADSLRVTNNNMTRLASANLIFTALILHVENRTQSQSRAHAHPLSVSVPVTFHPSVSTGNRRLPLTHRFLTSSSDLGSICISTFRMQLVST